MPTRADQRTQVTPMRDRRPRPNPPERPDPAVTVPDDQTRALQRRQSLDDQQRTFQGSYPSPHLFRRRPPG
jgi:hypothetical protein